MYSSSDFYPKYIVPPCIFILDFIFFLSCIISPSLTHSRQVATIVDRAKSPHAPAGHYTILYYTCHSDARLALPGTNGLSII